MENESKYNTYVYTKHSRASGASIESETRIAAVAAGRQKDVERSRRFRMGSSLCAEVMACRLPCKMRENVRGRRASERRAVAESDGG